MNINNHGGKHDTLDTNIGILTLDLILLIKLHGVNGVCWKFAIGLLNFRLTLQNNTIPVRKVTNQNSIVLSSQL